jgi:hypothetical protein
MTPIETAIAKVPLPDLFGAFEQQMIQDYARTVCQQAALLEASIGRAEPIKRASVELYEHHGNRYWDYDAGSGGPQAMSDLPLGTYVHTGEVE